jgi:hypothetical protein
VPRVAAGERDDLGAESGAWGQEEFVQIPALTAAENIALFLPDLALR